MRKILSCLKGLIVLVCLTTGAHASAGTWTLGVGYHNPPNATVGLDLTYFVQKFAFGIGFGHLRASFEEDNDLLNLAGDLDAKFLMRSGSLALAPELGLMYGLGIGGNSVLGFGAGSLFAGLKGYLFTRSFYLNVGGHYFVSSQSFQMTFGVSIPF